MKSLCDILNKDVMRDASSPLSFHQLTSLTLETIPQTSESPIVQDTTDHPDQHSTPDGIIKPSDIVGSGESHNEISLPEELFFGNPQLPPDPDNRFIPVTMQQPTTLFAYTLSTEAYLRECEAMRQAGAGGRDGGYLRQREGPSGPQRQRSETDLGLGRERSVAEDDRSRVLCDPSRLCWRLTSSLK